MADSPINTSAKRRTGKRLSIDFTGASFFSSAAKKSSITADGDRTTNSPESMRNGNEKSLDNMTEESNLSMPNRLRTFMRSSPLKPLPVVPTSDETTEETADEKKPGRKKGN
jgi:hypothetical protein